MTMIEKVARAINSALETYSGTDGEELMRYTATAAIRALMEPSDAVRQAMRENVPVSGYEWEYNYPLLLSNGLEFDDEGDCWRAMITAALEDK